MHDVAHPWRPAVLSVFPERVRFANLARLAASRLSRYPQTISETAQSGATGQKQLLHKQANVGISGMNKEDVRIRSACSDDLPKIAGLQADDEIGNLREVPSRPLHSFTSRHSLAFKATATVNC